MTLILSAQIRMLEGAKACLRKRIKVLAFLQVKAKDRSPNYYDAAHCLSKATDEITKAIEHLGRRVP